MEKKNSGSIYSKWSNDMLNISNGKIFRTFKLDFWICNKFRKTIKKFMPYNDRSCVLCNTSTIADEFHNTLECSALTIIRKK